MVDSVFWLGILVAAYGISRWSLSCALVFVGLTIAAVVFLNAVLKSMVNSEKNNDA